MAWRNERDAMTPAPIAGSDSNKLYVYEVTVTSQTRYIAIPGTYPVPVGSVVGIVDGSKQDGVTNSGLTVDFGAGNLTAGDKVTVVFLG